MEITLEKIELVKDRTGVTYKEAKEALENNDGNVVDAIVSIEEKINENGASKIGAKGDDLVKKMKEIAKKGNVSRIVVIRNGETLINIPLTVGVLGTVVAPWGMIVAIVASFGFKCQIEFVKDDGSVIDITEKAGEFYAEAREKAPSAYGDFKEKSADIYENLKGVSSDVFNKAKDVADGVKSKVSGDGVYGDFDAYDEEYANEKDDFESFSFDEVEEEEPKKDEETLGNLYDMEEK